LVGGMPKIFELNRNFRNEGISPRHNPEFTMLELYEAFGNYETMMELVEGLICHLAANVINADKPEAEKLIIHHANGRTINLQRPWRRVKMVDLVQERTGWKFERNPMDPELRSRIAGKYAGKITKDRYWSDHVRFFASL